MKNKITKLFLLVMSMTYGSVFAQTASYTFNSGNANDGIGTNHGTVIGAILTSDRFGNANYAYQFNAFNSSRIVIPNHSSNNFSNSDEFSISLWMKTDQTNGNWGMIICNHTMPAWDAYMLTTNNTNDGGYTLGTGTLLWYTASGYLEDAGANTMVASDFEGWHHVVCTYGGGVNSSKMYVDGILQTDIGSASGTISTMADFIIGAMFSGGSYTNFYDGKIDDIGVYETELTQAEVTTLYNAPNPVGPSSIDDLLASSSIKIMPNPASSLLNIELNVNRSKQTYVNVIDITGRVMSQTKAETKAGTNKLSIDIEPLAAGIYLVHVYADNKLIKVQKIEKE